MKKDHLELLARGRLSETLWRMCLPTVAAMTINGIYNVVDAFFIGLTHDASAIGAVSVIFPLFVLVSALGVGISVGNSSYISRRLGAGDTVSAQKMAGASVIVSVLLGVVTTAAGFIWMEPMLSLLGARSTIMPAAVGYTSWILAGNIFVIVNAALSGAIRAEGNSAYSTVALLAGTLLNIALDPVFIFACGMGIEGAAIATLISYVVTFLISAAYYVFGKSAVSLRPRFSDINRQNTREMLAIGSPALIKQLLLVLVFSMVNAFSAQYGEQAVTAAGLCGKINSFIAMTLMGIGQGFMPVAGFNFGAHNYERVLGATNRVLLVSGLFAAVSGIGYVLFGSEILALFCRDSVVIGIGTGFLHAFAAGVIPLGITYIMDALFSACGWARAAMLLSLSRQGLIFVPVILLSRTVAGLDGISWSPAVSDILCCVIMALPLYFTFVSHLKKASAVVDIEGNAEAARTPLT